MVKIKLIKSKFTPHFLKIFLGGLLLLFSLSVLSQGVVFDHREASVLKKTKESEAIQIAVPALPKYLSPYADTPLAEQYSHLFFDPLVRWSNKKGIEKRLISKWRHKEKGRVRFYLKKNIKFHSGYSLTSHDIAWTFKHLQSYTKSKMLFSSISKIKIINNVTFDVYTKNTENELLDLLTHFFILDAHFYQKYKISANQKYGILYYQKRSDKKLFLPISGTGPFKINSFNARLHLKVERNNAYWGKNSFFPLLDFVLIKSVQSRVYSLIAGDVAISTNVSNLLIKTINKSNQISLVSSPYAYRVLLMMNTKKVPELRDKNARYGLELAINRQGIVEHILKGYGSTYFPLLSKHAHTKTVTISQTPASDLKRSKALLKGTLVPNHLSLLVMDTKLGTTKRTINALFNMFHRAGISLITKTVSTREAWNKNKDKYDLYLIAEESYFLEARNQYNELFKQGYLAEILNKNINEDINKNVSMKNEVISVEQYIKKVNQTLDEKLIIPLFSQPSLYAGENKFNLNQIFSENGIPYWSDLKMNKPQIGERK